MQWDRWEQAASWQEKVAGGRVRGLISMQVDITGSADEVNGLASRRPSDLQPTYLTLNIVAIILLNNKATCL